MSKLAELAPSNRSVTVRGTKIDVAGIDATSIALLIKRFVGLKELATRVFNDGGFEELSVEDLTNLGRDVVGALIAASTGELGNVAAERNGAGMPAGYQIKFLRIIIEETMPGGVGPFVEEFEAIATALEGEDGQGLDQARGALAAMAATPSPAGSTSS